MIAFSLLLLLLITITLSYDSQDSEDDKLAHLDSNSGLTVSSVYQLDSELIYVHYFGNENSNSRIIFGVTVDGNLYRSIDNGNTWENQKLKLGLKLNINGIYTTESETSNVIITTTTHKLILTSDLGETYHIAQGDYLSAHMHPFLPNTIIALSPSEECNSLETQSSESKKGCHSVLVLTEDFGKTWNVILTYVHNYLWQPTLASNSGTDNFKKIFALVHRNKHGYQSIQGNVYDLISSSDFFNTVHIVKEDALAIYQSKAFIYISTLNHGLIKYDSKAMSMDEYLKKSDASVEGKLEVDPFAEETGATAARHTKFNNLDIKFFVSRDNLTSNKLYPVHIPHMMNNEFKLIDSSEGSAFVAVKHEDQSTGSLYISSADGAQFSKTLGDVVFEDNTPHFTRINSLEGVYIANHVATKAALDQLVLESGVNSVDNHELFPEGHVHVSSVISFDKGGAWYPIQAPALNMLGEAYHCDQSDHCFLHLIHDSIHSTGAIGLILGVGSVGASLSLDQETLHTYASRDGGKSWYEIAKGNHLYAIGNHGGIIVMANKIAAIHHIMYSIDEGISWSSHQISTGAFHVDRLSIEPTHSGVVFLVLAHMGPAGLSVMVDFSGFHESVCTGMDAPNSKESDFEHWSPSSHYEEGNKCYLGKIVTYVRRKRDRKCHIQAQHSPFLSHENCACVASDFHCDYGYTREYSESGELGNCIRDASIYLIEEECEGFTYHTKGYQKIAGNQCVGGDDYMPTVSQCAHNSHYGDSSIWVYIITFIIIGLVCSCIYYRNEVMKRYNEAKDNFKYKRVETGYRDTPQYRDKPDNKHLDDFDFDDDFDNDPLAFDEVSHITQKMKKNFR